MANWFVLICAVLAALASGVVLAYTICSLMFTLFRAHALSRSATSQRAAVSQAIQN